MSPLTLRVTDIRGLRHPSACPSLFVPSNPSCFSFSPPSTCSKAAVFNFDKVTYNDSTVFSDDPVDMALRWRDEGTERLHLVDLDGAKAGKPINQNVVQRIIRKKATGLPCQLGGGIRDEAAVRATIEDAGSIESSSARKLCENPTGSDMCSRFPEQARTGTGSEPQIWWRHMDGWKSRPFRSLNWPSDSWEHPLPL